MVDLSTSCVAHWKMNDNTANTIVIDDSGYSNDGAASENTDQMHVDGKINGGLYFDDSLHRYVQVPDDDSLSFLGEFSISFEVKRETATHTGAILCKSATGNNEYLITFGPNSLTVILYTDASNFIGASAIHFTTDWTHVMITYDDSKIWSGIKIYFNNVERDTTALVAGTFTGMSNKGANLQIGRFAYYALEFHGIIDNVILFKDHVLTADERAFLYNHGYGTESLKSCARPLVNGSLVGKGLLG